MSNGMFVFDEEEAEQEAAKAQLEQVAAAMRAAPPHPFVDILNHLPTEHRMGLLDQLLQGASDLLMLNRVDIRLLQSQLEQARAQAEQANNEGNVEGFTRALASVRASLVQWPEGACDQEVARLVSLIVHKAITDDAGALWVSAGMPPSREYIGEEFLVAMLMNAPESTPRYQRRVAVWHGDQGWVAAEDGRTRLHPAYWHHMPKGPRPEAPRHIAVEPQS